MVHQQFHLRYGSDVFPIDYDTSDGLDVLRFQIFSLTSVLPDHQKIVVEDGGLVLGEADDLAAISDGLRLVSLEDGEGEEEKPVEMSDEELAKMLQAEEDEISMQILQAEDGGREFEHRVRPMMSQVLMYEDPVRQEAARCTVPMDEIEEKALVWLAKEGTFNPSEDEKDYAFLLQLLFWFKQSFRWVNAPSCDGCGGDTIFSGMGNAIPVEIHYGCSRVELYRCKKCSKTTRFPRYNDPLKLLETRSGRCGEWANCFTLYCRAFGYESRLILDFTDHLWTECFSSLLGRWMHLDPCEGIYDKPLLYEKGWNKNLSYVIAISKDGTCDVTRRYTRKWHEVLSRRNITTEISAKAVLSNLTRERRNGYSSEILSVLESRDRMEENELDNVNNQSETSLTLPGRQSGSKEWRMSRLEIGAADEKSLSHTSCPIRTCVDDHVSIIYSSLSYLLCHFVSSGLQKTEVLIIFEILKQLLTDLKFSSFKVRKGFVDLGSIRSQCFKQSLPAIDEFLSAVSLRREANVDEKICISLAGSPVQTSISLPVALDGLNEIIFSLDKINRFDQCFLSNFSRCNRISSGSVLASGEEIPLGIATSAFDGGSTSKWEEPNGAKGCWLVYKVKDGQAHTLKAYELMSANDAPERDPMDWIVEGSEDEGYSWNIIDQQTSQIFNERFQRKRFEVESKLMLNAFRFKFLVVRDPKATSRFQIGSIDLFAAKS